MFLIFWQHPKIEHINGWSQTECWRTTHFLHNPLWPAGEIKLAKWLQCSFADTATQIKRQLLGVISLMHVGTVSNLIRVPRYYISRVDGRSTPTKVEKSVARVLYLSYRWSCTDYANTAGLSLIARALNSHLKCAIHLSQSGLRHFCSCIEVAT